MKITTTIALCIICICGIAQEVSVTFKAETTETKPTTVTVGMEIEGRFWTQWIVETNGSPRKCLVFFEHDFGREVIWSEATLFTTNNIVWDGIRRAEECKKEHLDKSDRVETWYVSSNLVSFLVWRGRTNMNYLESIPIRTDVRHWHWDKTKIFNK